MLPFRASFLLGLFVPKHLGFKTENINTYNSMNCLLKWKLKEMRAKGKVLYVCTVLKQGTVLWENYCTCSLHSAGEESQACYVKMQCFSNSAVLTLQSCCPGNWIGGWQSIQLKGCHLKMYCCVYSCARPANRSLESTEIGKWQSRVVENPIAQNSDVL